ncbi:MAG: DNA polymerase III subunit alpha [Moraxella sp.]|nr:DNA polymerase III subunit alpha [Moraxella sp.]
MSFTHLAVRTEYAIVDSIVRIKALVKAAKEDGQTTLGIADMSNLFAVVKFYKACIAEGIKPIIGTEVVIGEEADATAKDDGHSVILYAMDNTGYQNLLNLVSKSYTHGLIDGTPIIKKSDLFAENAGVIAILTERSDIGTPLKGNHPERAGKILSQWQDVFGDRLYIGIKRTHRKGENLFIKNAIKEAAPLGIPLVAFNDVRFLAQDDFDAHEARVCIAGGYILADTSRPHNYSEEQYFKKSEQMNQLFSDIPQVLENTNALASRCNVTLTLGINVLPDFPIPEGETIDSYFRKVSFEGLYQRLAKLYPEDKRGDDWQEIQANYEKRLEYELGIIIQMGFPGYFLIVMDFIRWAKENGVPVGPGRGSGAGSLVAYSLNITDLDPLAYDLLFERFLNPERVSMPDFDIDFCIEGRDRVIDYVAQKYGRDAVSQIITFGTMAAKAVVRDVARVQGKSYGLADKISKLIPKTPGISLAKAVEEEMLLKDLLTNPDAFDHEDAVEIWEMAEKLEGICRNVGKHAGGVLIAPNRISDFSAVYCDSEGHRVSQFDKDDVEAVGLVKFDFLGLRNLTVIKAAIDNIDARRAKEGKPPIDLDTLPLDDMDVYKGILQNGKTSAVFQLESSGMKKYLKLLKPSNIEDVIAMCALYRPGPLESGMVTDFIDRKHGIQPVAYPTTEYQHDSLQPPLESTYGVIVYQEQVMQIAQVLSGYTLGGADMLRRAMGKKKPEEMAKQKQLFVDGAINNSIDGELAAKIFELIEYFAGYGFNKSHSAAYGVLAYQTAYLKHYYPAEFMAAVLTSEMNNTDAVVFLIDDCKDNFGLQVLPPSVNDSLWHFVAKDPNTIVYGLGAVKGVGEGAVESIVNARKEGEFADLYDFCNRVDIKKVGKRALEALIMAGCFDILATKLRPELVNKNGENLSHEIRGALWEQLPLAMQAAEQNRNNSLSGTFDLFASVDDGLSVAPPLSDILWSAKERLKNENATLGLYLTGHPIDEYKEELKHYIKVPRLSELSDTGFKGATWFAGLIIDVANFGNRVAVTLDDGSARVEISCFTDRYTQLKDVLKIGEVVVVKGSVRESDGRLFTRLQNALTMVDARLRFVKKLNLKINKDDTERLALLLELFSDYGQSTAPKIIDSEDEDAIINDGCVPLALYIYDEFSLAKVETAPHFRLVPNDTVLTALKQSFKENFVMGY